MMNDALSIYIHVPFCIKKCLYCDFISAPADEDTIRAYFAALQSEIRSYKAAAGKYEVQTIYFGGGTPSSVDSGYITGTLDTLRSTFAVSDTAEISMEMNPGTAKSDRISDYILSGINRISVGLQSTADAELKRLGRIHTYADFLGTYDMLRRAGVDNINVDIMTGIPGQDMASAGATLERVAALSPEHISAYSLIIEPGTPFAAAGEAELGLPDEDTEMEIYKYTAIFLKSAGYDRYEISNYARPGKECRHNLVYWDRGSYLGFGLSAASLFAGRRFTNTDSMKKYIAAPGRDRTEDMVPGRNEQMEEFMFLGLRKIRGISRSSFRRCFGCEIEEVYGRVLDEQQKAGMLVKNMDSYALTDRGIDVSNEVLSEFLF